MCQPLRPGVREFIASPVGSCALTRRWRATLSRGRGKSFPSFAVLATVAEAELDIAPIWRSPSERRWPSREEEIDEVEDVTCGDGAVVVGITPAQG